MLTFRILYVNGKPVIYHLSGDLDKCEVIEKHYASKPGPFTIPVIVEMNYNEIKFLSVSNHFEVLRKENSELLISFTNNGRRGLLTPLIKYKFPTEIITELCTNDFIVAKYHHRFGLNRFIIIPKWLYERKIIIDNEWSDFCEVVTTSDYSIKNDNYKWKFTNGIKKLELKLNKNKELLTKYGYSRIS